VAYNTRVLSRLDEYPSFEEMADLIRDEHPSCRLSLEEGDEEEWEILLLSGEDNLEIALVERTSVYSGSLGQDEIADFLEDLQDCKPESGPHSGSVANQSSRPITKGSPTKRAFTSCGNSPTQSPARGIWASSETASGTNSKWTSAIPIIAPRFSVAKFPPTSSPSNSPVRANSQGPLPPSPAHSLSLAHAPSPPVPAVTRSPRSIH